MGNDFLKVQVAKIEDMSQLVKRYTLKAVDGACLPEFTGGAHIYVQFGDESKQFSNAYSLCSSPDDVSSYQIAVKKELQGRGGSIFLHDKVKEGDILQISKPNNLFALDDSQEFLLIGGGIGITPFMSQIPELLKANKNFKLLYLKHDDEQDVIEQEFLSAPYANKVSIHVTERGTRADLDAIFASLSDKVAIYACGNKKLFDALKDLCQKYNIAKERLHIEQFELEEVKTGAYNIVLQKSGLTIEAKDGETVLMAIERIKGPKIECLCRAGACGTCELTVLEGEVNYNDQYYEDDERDNKRLLACCCSGKSGNLVIDL